MTDHLKRYLTRLVQIILTTALLYVCYEHVNVTCKGITTSLTSQLQATIDYCRNDPSCDQHKLERVINLHKYLRSN